MGRGDALLEALDREESSLEVNLFPAKADRLANPKAMPVHQEEQSAISVPMPASDRRFKQGLHFRRGQVLSRAGGLVGLTPGRGDFPFYGGWSSFPSTPYFNDLAHGRQVYSPNNGYFRESHRMRQLTPGRLGAIGAD